MKYIDKDKTNNRQSTPATEHVSLMEPMTPSRSPELEELAFEVVKRSSALVGRLDPVVLQSVMALVQSMNCYYSNLIEDHNTHPIDIDKAMTGHYAADPRKRDLQEEAVAHIYVQTLIDRGDYPATPSSPVFLKWVHKTFYESLPASLKWAENSDTGERQPVIPGEFRNQDVKVGHHIGVRPNALDRFMGRFHDVYRSGTRLQRIQNIPGAHHRLLWIHPFSDGNGRTARLMTHAMFRDCDVGSGLWSVSRGFARREKDYKARLMEADTPRQGDLDGRGNLSQSALNRFSQFVLEVVVDQMSFMEKMLEPAGLSDRIDKYAKTHTLPRGASRLLREALFTGEVRRGGVSELLGIQERQARNIVGQMLLEGLLVSDGPRKPLRLGFPAKVLDIWFPKLYPMRIADEQ